jgi:hypothetical protein
MLGEDYYSLERLGCPEENHLSQLKVQSSVDWTLK